MGNGLFNLIGGIGLFLLGMRLMTDGLTASAGGGLRTILAGATRSRLRALGSGLLITTGVQSSSAVIFATIGFVNAGLLSLGQAIGLVYGANLGTTLTSWLVALAGFNLNLRVIALPAIGVGAVAWALSRNSRWGALGQAAAGFGLFFLGIDVLREAFAGLGPGFALHEQVQGGLLGMAAFVLSGMVVTLLTQSSSATLAITLTAAAGGMMPIEAAAAMIVGANVGTTSTAVLAAIGATSPAKRVAAAHVTFNVVTATVALALLPALLWLAQAMVGLLVNEPHIALALALFHTLTKLLGVGVMWPLTPRFVTFLERRFRSAEEDQARTRHLDTNLLVTPALAMDALGMELRRMEALALGYCRSALEAPRGRGSQLEAGRRVIESLQAEVGEYAARIHGQIRDPALEARLPNALRVSQYHMNLAELAPELARLRPHAHLEVDEAAASLDRLRETAARLLQEIEAPSPDQSQRPSAALAAVLEEVYQSFKAAVLRAGSSGDIVPRRMVVVLEYGSVLHRICEQSAKAAHYLDRFLAEQDSGEVAN
ncbi:MULTISPECIES: Na/Pi cotransporter family protein [unclassified Luteimonas]